MACLIAAPCSGSGKTLVSLCLAALLGERGESLQTFKVGPDYLDPQLLSQVSGRPCRNLDPLLCGEAWVERSFAGFGGRARHCLVEGVMGLFDGLGSGSEGSSAAVARQLQLPVVLVVEASRQAASLAALVRGFRDHDPQLPLAGVVLNRVGSGRHRILLAEALAAINVPLLGVLPATEALELPSRHLGLLPPHELADLGQRRRIWAELARQHLDLDQLLPLLTPPAGGGDPIGELLTGQPGCNGGASDSVASRDRPPPRLAVAADAAFHFRYPEAAELLEAAGAEVRPWQPLADAPLPPGCSAVLLPGGYPELHAAQLSRCGRSLTALRQAAAAGLPLVAECGGLLLLGRSLCDGDGRPWPMAGLLPFGARRGELSLGYRRARACGDGLLLRAGEVVHGHEFHRWQLDLPGAAGEAEVAGMAAPPVPIRSGLWQVDGWQSPARIEGWTAPNVHASWIHLHWAGCPEIPRRLVAAAAGVALRPGSSSATTIAPAP